MASDSTILTDILSPAADIDHDVARRAADAAIAAGWRPPARVIETAEELDALPVGAVVRTSEGRIAEKVAKWNRQHDEWAVPREEFSCGSDELDDLPAVVLWEPEQVARLPRLQAGGPAMTPEEIRAEAVEQLARTLARYTITTSTTGVTIEQHDRAATMQHTATAAVLVDALAEAGLLPTGVRYGVGQMTYGEPCCVHHTLHSAMLDRRAHQGPIRRQWTHDWQEVPE